MARVFEHELRVRFNECDPQGVVFDANYFVYFDVAITDFFRTALGPYGGPARDGTEIVVAEANARFLGSAGFDDVVRLAVAVERLSTTAVIAKIDVLRQGERIVLGYMRYVFIDGFSKQKRPIPAPARAALYEFLGDSPQTA
jgi:acyl-CoA thioester hydrolase